MSDIKFRPIGERVLFSILKETLSGRIILSAEDTTSMPQLKGVAIAVSDKVKSKGEIFVGKTYLFENVGVDITLEGKDYILVHETYVQGVLGV